MPPNSRSKLLLHPQEVNTQLDELEDSTHIDLSLITDVPQRRAPPACSHSLSSRLSYSLSTRSSLNSDGARSLAALLLC